MTFLPPFICTLPTAIALSSTVRNFAFEGSSGRVNNNIPPKKAVIAPYIKNKYYSYVSSKQGNDILNPPSRLPVCLGYEQCHKLSSLLIYQRCHRQGKTRTVLGAALLSYRMFRWGERMLAQQLLRQPRERNARPLARKSYEWQRGAWGLWPKPFWMLKSISSVEVMGSEIEG